MSSKSGGSSDLFVGRGEGVCVGSGSLVAAASGTAGVRASACSIHLAGVAVPQAAVAQAVPLANPFDAEPFAADVPFRAVWLQLAAQGGSCSELRLTITTVLPNT
jgi:hypothetical protein